LQFEPELRPYVIKRWLARTGVAAPGRRHLAQILERVVPARPDASPMVRWKQCELRRYRDRLYVMRGMSERPCDGLTPWDPRTELRLPWGSLSTRATPAGGLDPAALEQAPVAVGFRSGGERCLPASRTHSQKLKKLFQEWDVPPWERGLTPLLFVGDRLAAVASHCVCEGFRADADAVELVWKLNIYTTPEEL
jgi:tRNA(Ile)-lysidine synthase